MKILNFGSCNVDYVYYLDHIVKKGETIASDGFELFPGGKGLNQSIALSKAGAKVYHAGCLGTDGKILKDIMEENGVDLSLMNFVDEKNGHAIIQVSRDGENSIFIHSGSNGMITTEYADEVLSNFSEGDIILLQNEINNLEYIVKKAYSKGMCIILNPSPFNEKIKKLDFSMLSYIIMNEVEAEDITGCSDTEDALEYMKKKFPKLKIVLTLGKKGAIYRDNEKRVTHPIFKVEAVDTTAAGDTFTGFFVAGISNGDNEKNAIRTACCASAISVSRKGAAPSIPHISEVLSGLETMSTDTSCDKSEMIREKLEKYISENISDASLEGLGKALGYSGVYAGNIVKKYTGITFKEILSKKRLSFAAKLISQTDIPIENIIKNVGYENESHFRKLFKDQYGVNPLKYRKGERKK